MKQAAMETTEATETVRRTASKKDRVAGELRDQITSGRLPPDDLLPSENELMSIFGVSKATVRAALAVLRTEGLITAAKNGRGSFVRRPGQHPTHTHIRTVSIDHNGNYRDDEHGDGTPGSPRADTFAEVEPPSTYHINADVALALAIGVAEHTPLFVTDQLLQNQAGARIFVRTYLPFPTVLEIPALEADPFVSAASVYRAAREAGREPEIRDYVTARNPTPDDSRTLNIAPGAPMLITRRIATYNGRPLIMQESHRSAEDTQLQYEPLARPIPGSAERQASYRR